ncbi:hypothetical protein [Paracraurococcus lichenis]|uniref:Uncharacterized protein n=1 Tax=Paracraurococcus lichenis TaxID=3064888 RepID=A0ABT9E8X7_9PROT|nr:hypothetical protein [Paracraurococcus sp. LOR1-02]MDO9712559.1 hypothetical protein [Paracraurococcus sp. LOR1-02]
MTDPLERLRRAAAEPGHGRWSPLRRWLEENREGFAGVLPQRPNWQAIARELAAMGLTDGAGKPPTAAVACLTWHRVKEGQEAKAEKPERVVRERPPETPPVPEAPAPGAAPKRRFRRVGE